jgi:CRP-like cAMP-binding protein/predicted MFS family arabinose efflux permease
MTEQQRPDEEVEGHVRRPLLDEEESEDEVEGHVRRPLLDDDASEDDVEGHHSPRRPLYPDPEVAGPGARPAPRLTDPPGMPMSKPARRGVVRAAFAHRDFRYLAASLTVSQVGDWLYGVALVVYVFDQTGSPAWVAASAILRLAPYVLFGAIGGAIADRYDRRAVMIATDLARAACMAGLTAVALADAPAWLALGLAFASAAAGTPARPAQGAITPALVSERDLAAANAVVSVLEHTALVLGPALGGLLLLLGSPAVAFAVNGASFLASAALVLPIRKRAPAEPEEERPPTLARRLADGFAALARSGDAALLVGLLVAASFVYGQEVVLLVLVSEQLLGTGSEGVSYLTAAVGAGGLAAAGLTSRLAEVRRPGRTLLLVMLSFSLPLMTLALIRRPALAAAVLAVEGAGNIVFDVLAITMLQRVVRQEILGRVFGVVDSLAVAGILAGSLLVPPIVAAVGVRWALVVAGGTMLAGTAVALSRLRGLDRRAEAARRELAPKVELLEGLGVFEGAPRQSLEMLAAAMAEQDVPAGTAVVTEGEEADAFYVVRSGRLAVVSAGERGGPPARVNTLGPGDWFGEIGLLERIPRTATVQAETDGVVGRLAGEDFLGVLNQVPATSGTLLDGVVGRLARTHPSHRVTMREGAADAGPA